MLPPFFSRILQTWAMKSGCKERSRRVQQSLYQPGWIKDKKGKTNSLNHISEVSFGIARIPPSVFFCREHKRAQICLWIHLHLFFLRSQLSQQRLGVQLLLSTFLSLQDSHLVPLMQPLHFDMLERGGLGHSRIMPSLGHRFRSSNTSWILFEIFLISSVAGSSFL